ncbi:FTR1 family iron permease [Alteromonas sp. 14N.309.X.WAT.G.H12]|uniref:FTR1 family iron permease n=1 Tax=Alteromonas sp. 14N.309.X.WAT.G.H12 TaxID=3120824 RepID=UPI002FD40DBE
MLINTVVLFLRDMLPIGLLISLLLAMPGITVKPLLLRVAVTFTVALAIYSYLSHISQLAEGTGFELLKVAFFIGAWIGICAIARVSNDQLHSEHWGLNLLLLGIGIPNSLHFMVYFFSALSSHTDSKLLIGSILGLGISTSIAILLHIFLSTLLKHKLTFHITTWFVAAQTAGIATLLEQIDILPTPHQAWSTTQLVSDESEYGHLLNALLGYEATPSVSYLCVFFIALVTPYLIRRFTASTVYAIDKEAS